MNEIKELIARKKTVEKAGEGLAANALLDLDWPQTAAAYELKVQIGQGAFAKVWQARCDEKGTDVAIKIMELDNLTSSLDDIYQEVRVMLLSKNPCVLRAYACFVVKRSLWLVMPLMRKGSCLRIMKVCKRLGYGDGLREEWIATILKSTLVGLEYFHSQGKLHRDIKASNLLMDSDGSVMISDFGVAGWLPSGGHDRQEGERRTFVGTPCWMAPEVMEQTSPYNEKADIWSFGITALELAKGYAPYARLQPMKVLLMTIQNPPPSLKSYDDYQQTKHKFSRHFREIITHCLQRQPELRPSASTLLNMKFFKKAPANTTLVKELLEGLKIPDTGEGSSTAMDRKELNRRRELAQAGLPVDEDPAATPAPAPQAPPAQQPNVPAAAAPAPADGAPAAPQDAVAPGAPAEQAAPAADGEAVPEKLKAAHNNGTSFVSGSTWVFDDGEPDGQGDDFSKFSQEYLENAIKGEDGKAPTAPP